MDLKEQPLVSIIIPCYNAEKYIFESVNSAVNQTYGNIEIIVVDDGSNDNSLNEIKKFGDKITVISIRNGGQSAAENVGLKTAQGTYVKFFDSDDILHPEAIETQVKQSELFDFNDKKIVFGYKTDIDEKGNPLSLNVPNNFPETTGSVELTYLLITGLITGTPLHKKYLLDEVGGWDPLCPIMGNDFDLIIRLWGAGVEFHYYKTHVYFYREYNSVYRSANVGWTAKDPDLLLYLYNKWERIIMNRCKFSTDEIKQILAQKHIDTGRKLANCKRNDHASIHFMFARKILEKKTLKLDNHLKINNKRSVIGSIYLFFGKHFRYTFAENSFSLLKVIRRFSKRCMFYNLQIF
ncbi:MAG: glycosyltransferase [Bacteroidales bacterium]|nr:glycosyltransferase [Bacteroidales bacterium]